MLTVQYGTTTIEFTHQRNSTIKKAYISVDNDNGIVIKTPDYTDNKAKELVYQKASWIRKKLAIVKSKAIVPNLSLPSKISYLGKKYQLKIIRTGNGERPSLIFKKSKFVFTINLNEEEPVIALNALLDEFYKAKAKDKILPLVKSWSQRMKLYPNKVTLRRATKRWGSCSSANNISFNYRLMAIKPGLIEYVIVHELTHLKFRKHSKEYWKHIEKFIENYLLLEDEINSLKIKFI